MLFKVTNVNRFEGIFIMINALKDGNILMNQTFIQQTVVEEMFRSYTSAVQCKNNLV